MKIYDLFSDVLNDKENWDYDKSCFYEIVILNYFMSFSNCDMVFCSVNGTSVRAMEGFSVNVDMPLEALDKEQIRSFILPGGNISEIDTPEVEAYLQALMERAILIAAMLIGPVGESIMKSSVLIIIDPQNDIRT